MNDYTLLLSLILAHLVADFFLQPNHWVKARNQQHWRAGVLYYHGAIHFALNFFIIAFWQYFTWSTIGSALAWSLLLAGSHILIDLAKSYKTGIRYFITDQLLHLIIIITIWSTLTDTPLSLSSLFIWATEPEKLLLLLAYLLLLKPASVLISLILEKIARPENKMSANKDNYNSPTAGNLIGLVERVLVLTLILIEQYSAVGLVIAAKSVLRFNDLRNVKDKAQTEYVLLGSLLSFTLTLLVALAVKWLLPVLTL